MRSKSILVVDPSIHLNSYKIWYRWKHRSSCDLLHFTKSFSTSTSTSSATSTTTPPQSSNEESTSTTTSTSKKKVDLRSSTIHTSKLGRLLQYGGLAAQLGVGALTESVKRWSGSSEPLLEGSSAFLNPGNIQKMVSTLRTMRGAAMKLGQMLSIQDSGLLPPHIESIFSQLQNCADYIPRRQMNKVMSNELGPNWLSKFKSFDPTPFAAASIGQVHRAVLPNDTEVAVKIQYPGIANSIASDLAHVSTLVLLSGLLPKGLYLTNTLHVAERELLWETDYLREAEMQTWFANHVPLLCPQVRIPKVFHEVSTHRVLTMEYLPGMPLGEVANLDLTTRNFVASQVMQVCMYELFKWGTMQTDPNWSNFLYDPKQHQLTLLDFGSSRTYSTKFLTLYADILEAAAEGDREGVLKGSKEIGFLTGYETQLMQDTHVDAVMTLGEPFRQPKYDFQLGYHVAAKVKNLIPTMLEHRLTPPPDASYSLHRKVSGVFLLCTRLQAKIECRAMLLNAIHEFRQHGIQNQGPVKVKDEE